MMASCLCAAAQSTYQVPAGGGGKPPADAKPVSISGMVTNAVTGAPVVRAHVRMQNFSGGQQAYGAMTNGEGKFIFASLPAGHFSISLDKVGYIDQPVRGAWSERNLELAPGSKREDVKLALTPDGSISGRVLDPRGEPVPDCAVTAESVGSSPSSITDNRGQFRIGGLAPGKFRVLARPGELPIPEERRTDGTKDVHLARTWFPASLDRKSGQRVDVGAGADVTGIDIHMVEAPIISVSGRVIDGPKTGVMLRLRGPETNDGSSVLAKPDGSFHFWRVDPGRYVLTAMDQGSGMAAGLQTPAVEIQVGAVDVEHLELRMMAPFDLTGQLEFDDEGARQAPQMSNGGGRSQPPLRRRFGLSRAIANASFGGPFPSDIPVGDDDTFTVSKLPPGQYRISTSWGPYVKSVRQGSVESEGDVLDVSKGPNGPVTLRLSSIRGQVSGTVTGSDGPVAGQPVGLISAASNGTFSMTTETLQDGTYAFSDVPPGKYFLLTAPQSVINELQRMHEFEDYKDIVEQVEVRGGDKVVRNLSKK